MKAYLILCYVLWSLMLGMVGCTIPSDKEIYQSSRNEVLKVQDRVKEIQNILNPLKDILFID